MAKGTRLTDEIRNLITEVHLQHSDWIAEDVQTEVQEIILDKYPGYPSDWPSLSAVQKVIKAAKDMLKQNTIDPLSKPWSVPSVAKYLIPPETLPLVLKVWAQNKKTNRSMSIRESLWVSRLYYIYREANRLNNIKEINQTAMRLALREKAITVTEKESSGSHWQDAWLYQLLTQDSELILQALKHTPMYPIKRGAKVRITNLNTGDSKEIEA